MWPWHQSLLAFLEAHLHRQIVQLPCTSQMCAIQSGLKTDFEDHCYGLAEFQMQPKARTALPFQHQPSVHICDKKRTEYVTSTLKHAAITACEDSFSHGFVVLILIGR